MLVGSCLDFRPALKQARSAGCTIKLLHHAVCPPKMRQLADWVCDWTTFLQYCTRCSPAGLEDLQSGQAMHWPSLDMFDMSAQTQHARYDCRYSELGMK